jgi:Tol biopolymer transport system component
VAAGTTIHVPGTSTALDAVTEGDPSTVYQVIAAPDGSAIAYVSQIDGRARLVVRDLRSGEGQVIDSANGDAVAQVRFSPDSQAIAYTILYEQAWQLNVWDRESAASRTLQEGSTPLLGSDGALPFVLFPLAWTPNGLFAERILYATDAPPQGLALVDPQSGEVEIVRESPHLMAAATSDGSSFALMVGERPIPGAPIARIIRFDVADRSETELTPTREQLVQTMAWSPDGTQLLYTTSDSFEARETTLHLIQADGANERTIAFGQLGLLAPLRAAGWQDDATVLVLLWDEAQQFELHALPLSSFDERSLQSLDAFEATLQQGQSPQIVFVP